MRRQLKFIVGSTRDRFMTAKYGAGNYRESASDRMTPTQSGPSEADQLREQLKALQEKNAGLTTQLGTANANLKSVTDEYGKFKTATEEQDKKDADYIKRLEGAQVGLQGEITARQNSLDEANAKAKEQLELLEGSKETMKQINKENAENAEQRRIAEARASELKKANEGFSKQVETIRGDVEGLTVENSGLTTRNADLLSANEGLKEDFTKKQRELANVRASEIERSNAQQEKEAKLKSSSLEDARNRTILEAMNAGTSQGSFSGGTANVGLLNKNGQARGGILR